MAKDPLITRCLVWNNIIMHTFFQIYLLSDELQKYRSVTHNIIKPKGDQTRTCNMKLMEWRTWTWPTWWAWSTWSTWKSLGCRWRRRWSPRSRRHISGIRVAVLFIFWIVVVECGGCSVIVKQIQKLLRGSYVERLLHDLPFLFLWPGESCHCRCCFEVAELNEKLAKANAELQVSQGHRLLWPDCVRCRGIVVVLVRRVNWCTPVRCALSKWNIWEIQWLTGLGAERSCHVQRTCTECKRLRTGWSSDIFNIVEV